MNRDSIIKRMEKAFDKEGLRIKTAVPYGGGILVDAEKKDGSRLITTTLFMYHRGRFFFHDDVSPFYPAYHLDELDEIFRLLDEAKKKGERFDLF